MYNQPKPKKKLSATLSTEEIKNLLAKKKKIRGVLVDDLIAVHGYLMEYEQREGRSHPGPVRKIAEDLDLPHTAVNRALSEMKSDRWKKATGCTVPWQKRGMGEKKYAIVDSKKNLSLLNSGNRTRGRYNRVDAARLYSHYELQCDLETNILDKEWWKVMVFHLKQVLEVYDEIERRQEERLAT